MISSRISSSLGFETGRLDCIRWKCSAISSSMLLISVVSGSGARDNTSGSTNSLPGLYSSVQSYFYILSRILCSLGGAVVKGFFTVISLLLFLSIRVLVESLQAELNCQEFLEHILIRPQLKILMRKPRDNCLAVTPRRSL